MKIKQTILSIGLGLVAACSALAVSPAYTSLTGGGTTAAQVIFPANAGSQIRLVNLIATSDKATSKVTIKSGVGAYSLGYTNTAASTNLYVTGTNGLAINDVLIIQTPTSVTNVTLTSLLSSTNVGISAAAGLAAPAGSSVYKLGTATTLQLGANTNKTFSGEAVFVGNYGRPLLISIDGTSACSIDAATTRYE